MPVIYVLVLLGVCVLMLLSGKEDLLCDKTIPFILKPIRKSAVYLYRRIRKWAGRRSPAREILPGSDAVRKDLAALYPSRGTERRMVLYYIDKIQNLILFILLAAMMGLAAWYSSRNSGVVLADHSVLRPDYGEEDLEITVTAADAQEEDLSYGEYIVTVSARSYTQEQTDELAEELLAQLPVIVAGENEDLDTVTGDLNLITEAEGYPFEISWTSSRSGLIGSDGTVYTDQEISDSGEEVLLTAVLSYGDLVYEETISAVVYPLTISEEEQTVLSIQEALSDSNAETVTGEFYYLPTDAGELELTWTETIEDTSLLLFGLILTAGILMFALSDRDLHQKLERREREMALDYPQVIGKLVLFLGAGMSVRNSFARLGDDYLERRRKGGEQRYVYEEILLVCRELDSGISESEAYVHFGIRCRSRQYTRLCSLLTQNLKKGNHALLQVLQEEADLALEEKKSLARKMGEEAGTRLLLPMTLMLAVTLVIIMIPAYLSFSL